MPLPAPSELARLSVTDQTDVLDQLFEPCPAFSAYIIPLVFRGGAKSYGSYTELIEEVRKWLNVLRSEYDKTPDAELTATVNDIVAAHPRLGAPKKVVLSSSSASEQKSLNSGDPKLAEKLQQLNEQYEQTFPGLRYVVFVNGRSRPVIMEEMKKRIARNDGHKEVEDAFNAMCDIALDRAAKADAKL